MMPNQITKTLPPVCVTFEDSKGAVRTKQIITDKKVLIIGGYCKGSPDNPKFRLVYLPGLTIRRNHTPPGAG
jgi:hypothetical protein